MIETYSFDELYALDDGRSWQLIPGTMVAKWVDGLNGLDQRDPSGTGMIIAAIDGQATVLWSTPPELPLLQRHTSSTGMLRQIQQQLVTVQPMTVPAGNIFYLDYSYGSLDNADYHVIKVDSDQ